MLQANRMSLVKRLLEKYPDFASTINVPDLQGRTPLIHVAMKGGLELAGLLIDFEANPSIQDVYGKDAADYAGLKGCLFDV